MSTTEHKEVVRRVFSELNLTTLAILDEVLVPDYVHHDPAVPLEMQRGREPYKQGTAMFYAAFPDLTATVEELIAEGDRVASRLTWRGTHRGELMGIPPTGRQVNFTMLAMHRFEGGKIAEGWVNFDALGMMQQLGVIPPPDQA